MILGRDISADFNNLIANFHLTSPSWDMSILLIFIVLFLVYCFALRKKTIVILTLSMYMAFLATQTIPVFLPNLVIIKLVTFWVLFIFVFFCLFKVGLLRVAGDGLRWWQAILFNFFHIGLLISINLQLLPIKVSPEMMPIAQNFFGTDWVRFVWIIVPIALIPLIVNKDK